jgi:aryl-alcohol dehydrogenase-like predicted oxidoreductase
MAGMYASRGGLDDAASVRTIHRALELGVNHIDTAGIYGRSTARSWSGGPFRRAAARGGPGRSSASSLTPAAGLV